MVCPTCKEQLDSSIFYNVEVDYCPICLGIFFDENELRLAKDEKTPELRWLDLDLWKDLSKLKIERKKRIKFCPKCKLPLYQVNYGDSEIEVDICRLCKGVWLDRGEYKKIIEYLKEKTNWELLYNYVNRLKEEAWEIFTGPETFKEEILDLLALIKVLIYKFPERK